MTANPVDETPNQEFDVETAINGIKVIRNSISRQWMPLIGGVGVASFIAAGAMIGAGIPAIFGIVVASIAIIIIAVTWYILVFRFSESALQHLLNGKPLLSQLSWFPLKVVSAQEIYETSVAAAIDLRSEEKLQQIQEKRYPETE